MLSQRLLVAVIFLPLFAWLVFLPNAAPFFGFCLAGLAVAVFELGQMVNQRKLDFPYALALPAVLAMGACAGFPELLPAAWGPGPGAALFGVLMISLLALSLRAVFAPHPETAFPGLAAGLFAILLLGGVGSFVFLLRRLPHGSWWITLFFGFNWLYDAGALFAGAWFGRRALAPALSPRKTVEGVLGGLVVNLAAAAAAWAWLLPRDMGFSLPGLMLLGLGQGLLAQAGDLTESMIKRWSGAKDSAGFIPGHGGVLDKFDSGFFTAPVLYLVARLMLGS